MRQHRPTVLHVLEACAGGTERHVLDLVSHVREFDHLVAVPSIHHGVVTAAAAARLRRAGARVELVEMSRSRAPHRHAVAIANLRALVQRTHPAIVHGHSSIGGVIARLAARGTGVAVVYTPHGFSRSRAALTLERLLAPYCDRVIAVSESERQYALAHGIADLEQLVVIHNGIAPAPPRPLQPPLRTLLGIDGRAPLVGCVGRLAWQKAPEVFVAACAAVSRTDPDAQFVLIGSGPRQREVARAVARGRLGGRFHRLASLPRAAAALGELDVFALPSRFEGAPYTPLEAMVAGTPVVVSDVAGNRDLVVNRVNGIVVPRDDPEALAQAIVALLADASLRDVLVQAARRTVARFDVDAMAVATARLYRELCTGCLPATSAKAGEQLGVGAHALVP